MRIEELDGRFEVVDFTEFEGYRIACAIEKDGQRFYEKLLAKITKPELKEVFEYLIREEKEHVKFFENCLDELRKDNEDLTEDDDLLSSIDFGIFHPFKDETELEEIINDIQKVLSIGIVIENKTISFYKACMENISNDNAKNELASIIAEETKHKNKLLEISETLVM